MSDDRMGIPLAKVLAHGLERAARSDEQAERVMTMIIVGTYASGQARFGLVMLTSEPIGTYATTHTKK